MMIISRVECFKLQRGLIIDLDRGQQHKGKVQGKCMYELYTRCTQLCKGAVRGLDAHVWHLEKLGIYEPFFVSSC